ncbi:hypothetical protein VOI54_07145 [Tamlana sp. 2201CG12-4]|uniref:hypothetical protein n=1 Tax=Tamlana sp. 2201CG12-4 TaxID=3112582 RepID=UPI002DBF4FB3|nr:hypothetical protein [Tamlana sp. 2201CG12-4]MEC3906789.1 hypothetical protein [Tamlana sp. 2201CG12-4]
MKKVFKKIGVLAFVLVLFNCSTVQVVNSWKGDETHGVNGKDVLVITKADDHVARVRFETDLVQNLNENGINASESFKLFPEMSLSRELSQKELKAIKKNIKSNGIDVVVLTALKSIEEYTKTDTTGPDYYMHMHPMYYGRGFGRGFYGYYNSFYINSTPITSVTSKGKKYILETLTYDLTKPADNQLLSVITTEIDNPETLGVTSKDFSKKIAKELVK